MNNDELLFDRIDLAEARDLYQKYGTDFDEFIKEAGGDIGQALELWTWDYNLYVDDFYRQKETKNPSKKR